MREIRVAPSAVLLGEIHVGEHSRIAAGAVLRSEKNNLSIGYKSMVLEKSVVIGTPIAPVTIGSKTVLGHKTIVIGSAIGNLCEIGNGSIILPHSTIGKWSILGEGTMVPEKMDIPACSVVVGKPARIIRRLSKKDKAMIKRMRDNDISIQSWINKVLKMESRGNQMGQLYSHNEKFPKVSSSAIIYESAEITGDVEVGENTVIGAGVKIIGDGHGPVIIKNNVQILENSVLHLLPGNRLVIEDNVVIGPGSIVHGSVVEENTVIEAGVIVSDYSHIGKSCLIKAGSLIKQKSVFKPMSIIEGHPAKKVGTINPPIKKPHWTIKDLL